ncbi:unnamed protein product [Blepharisma stoltei]|uniref:Kinesin-like protein n=1 Tax=Blepharisma stoltei TaxID=1481888 RepID=A0AAU9JBF9_9CILI|nr:unnamed protein product [Blepharisma stoltei]
MKRRSGVRSKTTLADPDFASNLKAKTSRHNNIKVIARFRPLIDYEMGEENQACSDNHSLVTFLSENSLAAGPGFETFTLDHIFDPDAKQSDIYETVGKPVIEDVLNGYNGTIFAYGQTGSGKTHTMMGKNIFEEEHKGIIPRAAAQIFEAAHSDYGEIEYTLKCSMLEIYKETLRDLLVDDPVKLKIKQCPRKGIHVQGLSEVCVTNENDMLEVLALGQQLRTVASTKLNKTSSRSHLLFTLEVNQKLPNDSEKKGKLNLVDLAGSEKVNNSGVTGNKLEEAKKINLSLSALGNVIHALISYSDHIPYRDSKLTRLLQESLGGNYTGDSQSITSLSPLLKDPILRGLSHSKTIILSETVTPKNSVDNSRLSLYEDSQLDIKKSPFIAFEPEYLTGSFQLEADRQLDSSFPLSLSPEIVRDGEKYDRKLEKYKKKNKFLKRENNELREKITELEGKLASAKTKQLQNEQKAHEFYEKYHKLMLGSSKENNGLKLIQEENERLALQVSKFTKALDEVNRKFKEVNEKLANPRLVTQVEFDELSEKSVMQCNTPVMADYEASELEICRTENIELISSTFSINFDGWRSASDVYTDEIKRAIEFNGELNRNISIFHLKNQLFHASVINSNLVRGIHGLDWKFRLLADKYSLKKIMIKHQKEQIDGLEKMIDILHDSHKHMLKLYEQVNPEKPKLASRDPIFVPKSQMLRSFTPINTTQKRRFTAISTPKFTESCESETTKSRDDLFCDKNDSFSFQIKYNSIETSLELQRLYNLELKKTNEILTEQSETYQKMLNEFEKDIFKAQREERERWRKFFVELKENCESELLRKQSEVIRLNTLLGSWADRYMELQETINPLNKPLPESSYEEIKTLIKETLRNTHKDSITNLKKALRRSPLKKSFSSAMAFIKPSGDIPI